jgi:transposase-like protein
MEIERVWEKPGRKVYGARKVGQQLNREVKLTGDEREQLVRWAKGSSSQKIALRARIVLACAEPDAVNPRVASEIGVTAVTVRKWRKRFIEARLDGLADGQRPGRPMAGLVLTNDERDQLMWWSRQAATSKALALRSKIVLACARGGSNKQVAEQLGVTPRTVTRWRNRFIAERMEGLVDNTNDGLASARALGRDCQDTSSSATRSVTREISSRETSTS